MTDDFAILKSLLSWLKIHQVPIEIVTKTGNVLNGIVRKFDNHCLLLDELGDNDRNAFKMVAYSAIESTKNTQSFVVKGDFHVGC
ncbi:hypothetical protein ABZ131_20495 [Providencia rettgeri]